MSPPLAGGAFTSIGYRVNSIPGTQFRIWAKKVDKIDLQINTALPPKQEVFFNGQIFDAYTFVSDIIKTAKKSIILIDNYIDDTVLTHLPNAKKA